MGLDRALEKIVGTTARFNGKDVINSLDAFKEKMLMTDILDDKRFYAFP